MKNVVLGITVGMLGLFSTPASAIVVNNTFGAFGSRQFAQSDPAFEAVVALSAGCTGTLIAPNLVLAARHCGFSSAVRFGANSSFPNYTASVQSVSYPAGGSPGSQLLNGGDVSLLRLTSNVPSNIATPLRLTDETSSLVGEEAVMMGYGYNGLGSSGHGFTADGRRWAGTNIIDRYGSPWGAGGSNIFTTDFDNGTSAANTYSPGSPVPLDMESTTAPGDSGGPLLFNMDGEWVVASALSGGTTFNSVYGDLSWWTSVSPFRSQIESAGGVFYEMPTGPSCDLDGDGLCNNSDIRELYDAIASGSSLGDINGSGTTDNGDITAWLAEAGSENGETYVEGDTNLDGQVSGLDFSLLAADFGQEGLPGAYWENGNYNGNAGGSFSVGGLDFSLMALNFGFGTSATASFAEPQFTPLARPIPTTSAVPEPSAFGLGWLALVAAGSLVRRRKVSRG